LVGHCSMEVGFDSLESNPAVITQSLARPCPCVARLREVDTFVYTDVRLPHSLHHVGPFLPYVMSG